MIISRYSDDRPGERCNGLAVPSSHSATNLNQKSVIVSCVVSSPPSPTAGGCLPAPPPGGELSALTSGPHDTDDDDTDTTRPAMVSNEACNVISTLEILNTDITNQFISRT